MASSRVCGRRDFNSEVVNFLILDMDIQMIYKYGQNYYDIPKRSQLFLEIDKSCISSISDW